jgi:hypothetical protein
MVTIEHIHVETEKPFVDVAAALEARMGKLDPAVYEQLRSGADPEAVRKRLEGMAGPSGFMLFRTSDHGALLRLAGQTKKAVQNLLGNPLFAVRMTHHDIRAGLYAPCGCSSMWTREERLASSTTGRPRCSGSSGMRR